MSQHFHRSLKRVRVAGPAVYRIECINGHDYSVEVEHDTPFYKPHKCNTCDSECIRRWRMEIDGISVALRDKRK